VCDAPVGADGGVGIPVFDGDVAYGGFRSFISIFPCRNN